MDETVEAPENFIRAVVRRFGQFGAVLPGKPRDLSDPLRKWAGLAGAHFLVPPLDDPRTWTEKAWQAVQGPGWSFTSVLLLLRDAPDEPWFKAHVRGTAVELSIKGGLTFKGHTSPFPDALILAVYGDRDSRPGRDVWWWQDLP